MVVPGLDPRRRLGASHRVDLDERLPAVVCGRRTRDRAGCRRTTSHCRGRRCPAAMSSLNRSQRFLVYGLAGWCSEVVSTSIRSHGRDANWRLTGTTYAWMLPIYGLAAVLFEPADTAARRNGWPWWQRGLIWTAGIYSVEAASGEVLR